jgi:hypothetical protein
MQVGGSRLAAPPSNSSESVHITRFSRTNGRLIIHEIVLCYAPLLRGRGSIMLEILPFIYYAWELG